MGVATPNDLITDKTQTPFNIGKAIELHGFQLDEAQPLAKGLEGKVKHPQAVIQEILNWTGGQPFLTQKICQFVVQQTNYESIVTANSVCEIVQKRLIENWETQDEPEHLKTIRDRILRNEQKTGRLLGIYQEILQHGEYLADGSSEQTELRLSGLVVQQQGKLKVYNQIYLNVFNQNWVDKQLEKLRPYSQNFRIWVIKEKPDKRCGVRSINFSPDGKTLAVACSYGNFQLWDITTETVVLNLQDHSSHVFTVSFSPDGKILASGGADSTVKLWKVADGSLINTIIAHLDDVRRVTFSPDGKTLASASDDRTIKLWNVADGTPIKTLKGHRGAIISLSFTPDGKTLASGSSDNTVKIWNLDLDCDDLLKRSCLWLKDYFTTHPQEEGIREICQNR